MLELIKKNEEDTCCMKEVERREKEAREVDMHRKGERWGRLRKCNQRR